MVYCENTTGFGGQTIKHFDIKGTEVDAINEIDAPNLALNNVNPGDYITLDACITNAGNKSAWVRPTISITSESGLPIGDFLQQVTITTPSITEPITIETFIRNEASNPLYQRMINTLVASHGLFHSIDVTPNSITVHFEESLPITLNNLNLSEIFILNGTGTFAEKEEGAIVDNQINLSGYQIGLSTTAGNIFQGRDMSIGMKIEALQYRNNPTPNWADAVDYNAEP